MNGKMQALNVTVDDQDAPLFVYPDPVTSSQILSGAVFLYFQRPLLITLPPQVITRHAYDLIPAIQERRPDWSPKFSRLFNAWRHRQDGSREMLETLDPLKGKALIVAWVTYPANSEALQNSATLAAASGLSLDTIAELIDPLNASGEIIRHIMLEKFLELDQNVDALFNYCGELFAREPLEHLLAKGYLLRLPMWRELAASGTSILLTNERLADFLTALPVETTASNDTELDSDVIAWELFRQILSPRLDPLDKPRAEFVAKLLESRSEQITRLKVKCSLLAEEVKDPSTLAELPNQVERIVRTHVEREVAELLELNRRAAEDFFLSLFSDKATWTATLASIASLIPGHIYITAGAAIAALSSVGAHAFKAASDRHRKLKQSDYALIYSIARRV